MRVGNKHVIALFETLHTRKRPVLEAALDPVIRSSK